MFVDFRPFESACYQTTLAPTKRAHSVRGPSIVMMGEAEDMRGGQDVTGRKRGHAGGNGVTPIVVS